MKPELVQAARHRLEDILSFFEVNAEVAASSTEDSIELTVSADGGGRLIGHRGETLAAIQHVMNMMMRAGSDERVYVHVDIGGYREARLAKLEEEAQAAVAKVRAEGVEVPLPMMSAAERRHIHAYLTDEAGVTTESRGDGSRRRLVVKPAA